MTPLQQLSGQLNQLLCQRQLHCLLKAGQPAGSWVGLQLQQTHVPGDCVAQALSAWALFEFAQRGQQRRQGSGGLLPPLWLPCLYWPKGFPAAAACCVCGLLIGGSIATAAAAGDNNSAAACGGILLLLLRCGWCPALWLPSWHADAAGR